MPPRYNPKSVLFIPNEPLEIYEQYKQSYNLYPYKYFDLEGRFEKAYFSYLSPNDIKDSKIGKFYIHRVKRTNIFKSKFLNYLNIFDYFRFINETVKFVKENNIQLIRAYNNHVEGYLACVIGKKARVPVVVSVHNDFYYERRHTKIFSIVSWLFINNIQRILEFLSNRMSTSIFVVSSYLKHEIAIRGHINPQKIKVIYNKVELEKFSRTELNEQKKLVRKYGLTGKKVFFFLGRFVWQKNIFILLEAFKKLSEKHKDAVLLMVSDGPLKSNAERYIRENDLNVQILGFVSNDMLPSYFRISDAFILPSLYEGFGIVLIEAQAAGCPIIVSDIPSVKDIVSKENSYMFDPKDSDSLCERMELFYDKSKSKEIESKRIRGLKDVKRFDWDVLAKNELKLYEEIVKG